jgi:lysophospholipase L1-like esterase
MKLPLLVAALCLAVVLPPFARADAPLLAVGVAKRDITPDYPVRLNGYGSRREPSKGIAQRLHAKALAFGEDSAGGPAVLITVDNCAVPAWIRTELFHRLSSKTKLQEHRLSICSSHTHCAPLLTGVLENIFGMDIPEEHRGPIERYTRECIDALEQVVLEALAHREPSRLAWGIGSATFATNRRSFPTRPVDHALPVLRVTDKAGKVTAIVTSYACHCTTLGFEEIHADWAGYAQEAMEREFPGAIALTAIGCGADQNPIPRRTVELARQYGESLAAEAKRLALTPLLPLSQLPEIRAKSIELAFDTLPTREGWEALAASPGAVGYQARKNLARLDHGEKLRTSLPYLVQTWAFADDLAMVFLPGEVVVDYALRLKTEFDHKRLWVNGYANDVPAYIPSKRVLLEGGYEAAGAMVYYDRPSKFAPDVEQRIVNAVHELLPATFLSKPPAGQPRKDIPAPYVAGNPRLTLPRSIHAVAGLETAVYFANTILAEDPSQYRFEVDCRLGKAEPKRWAFTPAEADAGTHAFTLRLLDAQGRAVASAQSELRVAPAAAGAALPGLTVLTVGDSLTAAGIYPTEIARLFSLPGNPALHMLGTRHPKTPEASSLGAAHEGYGGWKWKDFLTRFSQEEPKDGRVNQSPFVFPTAEPPGFRVDFKRYLTEKCDNNPPDFLTVLLGINDCFGLKAENPTAVDQGITEVLLQAEGMIAEFRKVAPKAKIGICLVPTPNDREAAFVANYKEAYPRWNWRQIQHRVVERQLKHFFDREKENLFIVPTELNIDSWNGYPETNAVHPNEAGYRQIAGSIYAWIKNELAR